MPTLSSAVMLAAAAWRLHESFGHMMWLDELYTTTLAGASSLGHLWDGATRGVDGNPPLYMSLAWALTSVLPGAPEQVLRPLNLLCHAGTAALVYRIARRFAPPCTVVAALVLLPCVSGFPIIALVDVRTYALYLLLVTTVLFQTLRVVDRPTPGRTALLAVAGVLATLSHSFGGFYAIGTMASAGVVCLSGHDRRGAKALAAAAGPAGLALAGWIALAWPAQRAVATPYGWIPQPDLSLLALTLTGSELLTAIVAAVLLCAAVAQARSPVRAPLRRDTAALCAVLAAYAALTIAGWAGSHVITPFFVPRYFMPDLLIGALALVAAAVHLRRRVRPRVAGLAFLVCLLAGMWGVARDEEVGPIPCRDAGARLLESGAALGGLPVVAESPDAWMIRNRYAPEQATLYALDWQTVLDHPNRARNNAMDFHIMEILRGWAPPGSPLAERVLTTEQILERHSRFLVLDEARRAWFDALRTRTPLSAILVEEGPGCRLWDVRQTSDPAPALH